MKPPAIQARRKRAVGKRWAELTAEDDVFTTKSGQPIEKHLDHFWRSALRKAGLRHRPSYQLRHTFGSLCLESGVTPGWLANVLGHSTSIARKNSHISVFEISGMPFAFPQNPSGNRVISAEKMIATATKGATPTYISLIENARKREPMLA